MLRAIVAVPLLALMLAGCVSAPVPAVHLTPEQSYFKQVRSQVADLKASDERTAIQVGTGICAALARGQTAADIEGVADKTAYTAREIGVMVAAAQKYLC